MTSRTRTSVVLSTAILALSGCSESSPSLVAPHTPPPVVQKPEPETFRAEVTLSGTVFEETASGRTPIERVWVYCEPCTADTHASVYTDSKGFYRFSGVWTNGTFPTRISAQKDGYEDPKGLPTPTPPNPSGPGWREVVINGNTQFDIQLVRR